MTDTLHILSVGKGGWGDVDIVSNEDAFRLIDEGRIQDAKSIASLLRILPRS